VLVPPEEAVVEQLSGSMRGTARGDSRIQVTGIGSESDDKRTATDGCLLGTSEAGRDTDNQQDEHGQISWAHAAPPLQPWRHYRSMAPGDINWAIALNRSAA
jgi:hypothetical protein